jgi:tRNA1(Val) A37 N6-methylase TrmN6
VREPVADDMLTHDALLGGRVVFHQPAQGYRAAIDPVLLAASIPETMRGRVADLGTGAGAATLCLAARLPGVAVVGIERDGAMADIARRNVAANALEGRVTIVDADLRALPASCAPASFDAVIANPPFLEAPRANAVPHRGKEAATVESEADLAAWIDTALRLAKPKALLAFIHRADRLADLLASLRGRAGAIVVFPLWPRQGEAARRVIVQARKGMRTPLTLAGGLVLHGPDGRYTEAADAVLRGAGLHWQAGAGGLS